MQSTASSAADYFARWDKFDVEKVLSSLDAVEVAEEFTLKLTRERSLLDAEEDALIAVQQRVVGTIESHIAVARARLSTGRNLKFYHDASNSSSSDSLGNAVAMAAHHPAASRQFLEHIESLSLDARRKGQAIDTSTAVRRLRRRCCDKALPAPQRLQSGLAALQTHNVTFIAAASLASKACAQAGRPPPLAVGHRPVLLPCVRIPDPVQPYSTYDSLVKSIRSPEQLSDRLHLFAWRLHAWILLDVASAYLELNDPTSALAYTTPILELAANPASLRGPATTAEQSSHGHGHSHGRDHSHGHGHGHSHGSIRRSDQVSNSKFPPGGGMTGMLVVSALLCRARACHGASLVLLSRLHLERILEVGYKQMPEAFVLGQINTLNKALAVQIQEPREKIAMSTSTPDVPVTNRTPEQLLSCAAAAKVEAYFHTAQRLLQSGTRKLAEDARKHSDNDDDIFDLVSTESTGHASELCKAMTLLAQCYIGIAEACHLRNSRLRYGIECCEAAMQLLERLSKYRSDTTPHSIAYVCEALDAKSRLHLLQTHGRQQAFATIKVYFQAAHHAVFLEKKSRSGQEQRRPMSTPKYLTKAGDLLKVVLRRMRQNGENWPPSAADAMDSPSSREGPRSLDRPCVELGRLQQQIRQSVGE